MSDPVVDPRRGLTAAEVEASRRTHGANVLTPPPRDPWWKQYLAKFDDPVIRILIIAAALAIAVGAVEGKVAAEGVGIVAAIFLATFLAFWNELRAGREFDILNRTTDDTPVKVVRDGGVTTVPRREVVVGDRVVIETGEEVPADGRVAEAVGLSVSEAKLTGEARPVTKRAEGGKAGTIPAGEVRRGAVVVDGYGVVVISAVGDRTEFGKTLRDSIGESDKNRTLNAQLAKLGRIIGVVGFGVAVVALAALVGRAALTGALVLSGGQWAVAAAAAAAMGVALANVWLPVALDGFELIGRPLPRPRWLGGGDDERSGWAKAMPWVLAAAGGAVVFAVAVGGGIAAGWVPPNPTEWLPKAAWDELLRSFMIAVTIIVVAVPEGLAMSVTLSLAYSMRKMTAANTLVRRMDACETIGAVTVICSDKTGTLTRNDMHVADASFPDGLAPLVAEAIAANSTAHLSRTAGQPPVPVGNPTEGALLLWLDEKGTDYAAVRTAYALGTRWTFNTNRKMMGTAVRSAVLRQQVLHVKGAPEVLLERCEHVATSTGSRSFTQADRDSIHTELADRQRRGMRTLGFAYRPDSPTDGELEDLAVKLVWLGFAALADPVRAEVPAAVASCLAAGVRVKVVTGDNPETACEVARQIGLWSDPEPTDAHRTGAEFAALTDAEASEAAGKLKVMSRARPADKLRLVQLLKARGEVVAVTGDGVNDGPALNHADVGLAMGRTGTAVAKEASDIILLDDSFASVTTAILWGRGLYENIQRFVLFQLTINMAALGLAVLGPFVGFALPLTVLQMLWVNLIMDTFAALALATEPPHPSVLARPPRSPAEFLVTGPMAVGIFAVGGVFLAVLLAMIWTLGVGSTEDVSTPTRNGTLLFSAFVLLQFWNLFNAKCLNRTGSVFPTLRNNPAFLLIAAAILSGQYLIVQFGGAAFRTVPLGWQDWAWLLAGTSVVLWAGEAWRWVKRRQAR